MSLAGISCEGTQTSLFRQLLAETSDLQVFGTDTHGRVRGLGLGVSRSIMHNSNPYKRAYEEEHKSHVALETEVDRLKSRMADMEKSVASLSQSGTQMRSLTDHKSSSRVRPPSTHQETQASSRSTLTGTTS